ncbi:MAG: NAD(P)H-dependent oxidoreductase [Bacteroidota bacterium]
MKKIVAFGASSSNSSINKKFATYAAHQVPDAEVNILDLNDFEMPIYSVDKEKANGIPQLAIDFKAHLKNSDGIIISFAEHNGAYTTAFKNIMDWISRIESDTWASKPMLLLSTSPGERGAQTVLDIAVNKFKLMNKNATIAHFSLPSFGKNLSDAGITDPELKTAFEAQLHIFVDATEDVHQEA